MPESLPGDPTEAGPDGDTPDNLTQAMADKNWNDMGHYLIEDLQFALRRFGDRTHDDRSMLREAFTRTAQIATDAEHILRGMEAPWTR